jgi:hypothetical protein
MPIATTVGCPLAVCSRALVKATFPGGAESSERRQRPKAILWYQVYCWILASAYLLVVLAGIIILMAPAGTLEMEELEKRITAGVCIRPGTALCRGQYSPFVIRAEAVALGLRNRADSHQLLFLAYLHSIARLLD